ncbi:flagellar hook-length control protein FliK [Rhodoferax sp.]|uniref:flagellar hook-length control protein FliK n=1 Tax=Rhodoferax sp. TaxID=50421 RepID=UPI0026319E34|nr:flagellar hook-length control protein FliK [Rhodoferax sp.]MDD2925551.1 flagellar hook-length control protein FliK [Rhodoferax sp.]
MSVESSRAPQGAKSIAGAEPRGAKKPGGADALSPQAGGGFSALMSLLSATDPVGEVTATGELAPEVTSSNEEKDALAQVDIAQLAINYIANLTVSNDTPAPVANGGTAAPSTATLNGGTAASPTLAGEVMPPVLGLERRDAVGAQTFPTGVGAPVQTTPATSAAQASGKRSAEGLLQSGSGGASDRAGATDPLVSDASVQQQVETLLGGRSVAQAKPQGLSQVQMDLRDARAHPNAVQPASAVEVSNVLPASTAAELLVRTERPSAKSTQSNSGLEGALGGATTSKTPADAVYEVAPTSAVVPDTQVAETVSYWVTHGVQSAELTLDGLGGEPVKVRISLDGDQAQVDFLSNQVEVRQVLESASAQLKELLSSEGLQLAGMSVGTSGQGGGQNHAPAPSERVRQTRVVAAEPIAVVAGAKGGNPSVGQALDLFV